jgi:hypothetical protein
MIMIHHVSHCHGAPIFYEPVTTIHVDEITKQTTYTTEDVPTCTLCGEECEPVKVPPSKDEIALVRAERRADRGWPD